jgi:excinuclease ABC subunit A
MDEINCSFSFKDLKKESLFFKIEVRNIANLSAMDVLNYEWFKIYIIIIRKTQNSTTEILKEINRARNFLFEWT